MNKLGTITKVFNSFQNFLWKGSIQTSFLKRDLKRTHSNRSRRCINTWRRITLTRRHSLKAWKARTKMKIRVLNTKFQGVIGWTWQLRIEPHLILALESWAMQWWWTLNTMNDHLQNKRKSILMTHRRRSSKWRHWKGTLMRWSNIQNWEILSPTAKNNWYLDLQCLVLWREVKPNT